MTKISGMSRDPTSENKIQAHSIAEIKDGFDADSKRLARRVKFRSRKLRPGPLLNAVVLHYLSLAEQERERIATDFLAVYETLLEHDDPKDDLLRSLLADSRARNAPVKVEPLGGRVLDVKPDRKRAKKLDSPAGE